MNTQTLSYDHPARRAARDEIGASLARLMLSDALDAAILAVDTAQLSPVDLDAALAALKVMQ